MKQRKNRKSRAATKEADFPHITNQDAAQLAQLILSEKQARTRDDRYEKYQKILLLLAGGAMLATVLAMPNTIRLFKGFLRDKSDWDGWKMFNENYLRRTLRRLAAQKLVEIEEKDGVGIVKLTEQGRTKLLKFGLESLSISKPSRWDGKWRLVFYDVSEIKKETRERLRRYLLAAGFFLLQDSVYLHAYPCEKEVEFLRHYLGVAGEVRMIIADKIENDQQFRDYFGV